MGYHRYEIIGAMLSIFIIWGLLIILNYEATMRIINPPEENINADIMIVTACIGFLCNVTNFVALHMSCGKREEDEEDIDDMGLSTGMPMRRSFSLPTA